MNRVVEQFGMKGCCLVLLLISIDAHASYFDDMDFYVTGVRSWVRRWLMEPASL